MVAAVCVGGVALWSEISSILLYLHCCTAVGYGLTYCSLLGAFCMEATVVENWTK